MISRLQAWWRNTARLRSLDAAKQQADAEVRRLRAECDDLHARLATALADGVKAREQVADWLAEWQFGRPIYGPFTLVKSDDAAPPPRRLHGRDLVRRATPIVLDPETPNDVL